MRAAAAELRFEEAALLRDELVELRLSGGVPPALAVEEPGRPDVLGGTPGADGEAGGD